MNKHLARERLTMTKMVGIYCAAHHHGSEDALCDECGEFFDYAHTRLEKCPYGDDKPTCANCPIHCYKPARKEQVKRIMRYAGPRMLLRHPILAITHQLDGFRAARHPRELKREERLALRKTWVRETGFGEWFLNSDTWVNRVLKLAMDDLESLLSPRHEHYPTILDVGFGRGHSLPMLDQRFRPDTLIGLDINPAASQWAAQQNAVCDCDVRYLQNNASAIDLPDQSVDMVLCHQTLHHIVDQAAAVKEFYRVLRPGGVLLMAESCRKFIYSLPVRVLFRHPMDMQKTDSEYLQLLQDAGFVTRPENISRPYPWWSRRDLGLLELLGKKPAMNREETQIDVAAYRLS